MSSKDKPRCPYCGKPLAEHQSIALLGLTVYLCSQATDPTLISGTEIVKIAA